LRQRITIGKIEQIRAIGGNTNNYGIAIDDTEEWQSRIEQAIPASSVKGIGRW
jgi:hypothetical protein